MRQNNFYSRGIIQSPDPAGCGIPNLFTNYSGIIKKGTTKAFGQSNTESPPPIRSEIRVKKHPNTTKVLSDKSFSKLPHKARPGRETRIKQSMVKGGVADPARFNHFGRIRIFFILSFTTLVFREIERE